MTTDLDPIFISNSQLFKVDVFDVDGVTPLTPSSCVCDVWNRDTNTQVISNQNGTVGAGYAQCNWAGNATPGHYEAVLTVTISGSVIKSENFLVEVLAKPQTFTTDVSTSIGKVRLLIPDRIQTSAFFSDPEIQAFLDMSDSSVKRAAAEALDVIASDQAMVLKVISLLDLQTDGVRVSAELRARAKDLRSKADQDEAGDDALFDVAEMGVSHFQQREIVRNKLLRLQ